MIASPKKRAYVLAALSCSFHPPTEASHKGHWPNFETLSDMKISSHWFPNRSPRFGAMKQPGTFQPAPSQCLPTFRSWGPAAANCSNGLQTLNITGSQQQEAALKHLHRGRFDTVCTLGSTWSVSREDTAQPHGRGFTLKPLKTARYQQKQSLAAPVDELPPGTHTTSLRPDSSSRDCKKVELPTASGSNPGDLDLDKRFTLFELPVALS